MKARRAIAFSAGLMLLALLGACGGKYEVSSTGDADAGQSATSRDGSSGASGTGKTNKKGSLPTHTLGACSPGFNRSENPARPCDWVTDQGQCFDSFDAACACICPSTGNSLCSGSFSPDPSGATTVHCDKA